MEIMFNHFLYQKIHIPMKKNP